MKQLKTIEQLKELFPQVNGIEVALLYGSFGRKQATPNSDIDIQVLVNKEFDINILKNVLQKEFDIQIQAVREVAMRNKVVVYFSDQPKIEFAICTSISEIDRNYLGSEITNVVATILFEKEPNQYEMVSYLNRLIINKQINNKQSNEKQIVDLIDKFVYEFESCSCMHRRSDGYQFYFFYNIALSVAIQLNHLSKGETKFNFLPKNFIANVLEKEEQTLFYNLRGTLFLPEANQQKRKLLDFFYSSIQTIISIEKLNEVNQFCEWLYNRDFLWNFRDISTHNPKIKSGIIFRTATMTLFQNDIRFMELMNEKNIKTVVDLRADREINELPYSEQIITHFNYVKAPLDPWNQPDWFKQIHHSGTNEEIAYRFFALGCKDKIKQAMEAIINESEGAIVVHCYAGMDRTGILITLLHLLVETPIEAIHADYLASENNIRLYRLKMVLDIINNEGGIESYLLSCGLPENQISQLKIKLLN